MSTTDEDEQARADRRACWAQEHGIPAEFVETEEKFQAFLEFVRSQP